VSSKRRQKRLQRRAQEAKDRERLTTWLAYHLPLGGDEPWQQEGRERLRVEEESRDAQQFFAKKS
jgi:hypothetical protein